MTLPLSGDSLSPDSNHHSAPPRSLQQRQFAREEVLAEMRRKIAFVVIAVVGVAAVALGVKFGDPETIHRFASQI